MPNSYRGITIPDDTDWADIEVAFRGLVDSSLPVGLVQMFFGAAAPAGWLLCNGATIPAGTEYDALRTLVGGTVTPNFQGRSPFGPGASGVTLKSTGGAQTVALTTAQLAAHAHGASTDSQGWHSHTVGGGYVVAEPSSTIGVTNTLQGFGTRNSSTTDGAGTHGHNVTVNSAGSGSAHENMPPYLGINFIIKY